MSKKRTSDSRQPPADQEPALQTQKKRRYMTRSVSLGRPLLSNLNNVAEVLEMIEDEEKWRRGLKTRGE